MTKDFKEETTRTENAQYGISWMLGGVAVGLLAGIIIFNVMGGNETSNAALPTEKVPPNTNTTTNTLTTPNPSNAQTPLANSAAPTNNAGADTRPGFSYHAVLPVISMNESLAPVMLTEENPDPEAKPAATKETNQTAKAETKPATEKTTKANAQNEDVASSGTYMFQLGAYRSQAPALEMQNKARKYGMNTRIEQANVNGQVWYRIRIGPTKDQGVANRWRQSISAMGIDPIMIRM